MPDPQTRAYLDQPDFQAMIRNLNSNPASMNAYLADPRFQVRAHSCKSRCIWRMTKMLRSVGAAVPCASYHLFLPCRVQCPAAAAVDVRPRCDRAGGSLSWSGHECEDGRSVQGGARSRRRGGADVGQLASACLWRRFSQGDSRCNGSVRHSAGVERLNQL